MSEPTHETMVERLLGHWYDAREIGYPGMTWYLVERRWAETVALQRESSLPCVAGMAAALSPQVPWERAKSMTVRLLSEEEVSGQTQANIGKALRVMVGEDPDVVLSGPKVRAFYRALLGDEDAAVVDTWMFQAVEWHRRGYSPAQYSRVAAALTESAILAGVATAPFQAVVWTQVRGGGD